MTKYVAVGKVYEATFGTEAGSQDYAKIKVTNTTDPVDRQPMIEETIDSFLPTAAFGGPLKISGTIEGNWRAQSMQYLLGGLFGAATTSGNYTYYSPTTNPRPMDIIVSEDDMILKHVGVCVTKVTFNLAAKEFVTAKWDWFAASVYKIAADPAGMDDYISEDPITFYNANMTVGGSTVKIKDFTIDVDRKLDDDYYIVGDFKIQGCRIGGNTSITGSITFGEDEYDQFRRAIFGSAGGTGVPSTNALGSGSITINCTDITEANTVIQVTMPTTTVFNKAERTMRGKDTVDKKVDYTTVGDGFRIRVKTS